MTYYSQYNFSSADLAGAIAEAAMHDLRVNGFGFEGFPQIFVQANSDWSGFQVTLSFNAQVTSEMYFEISLSEAKSAVGKFKSKSGYDHAIFDRVQIALAALEEKASEAHHKLMMGKV